MSAAAEPSRARKDAGGGNAKSGKWTPTTV